MRAATINFAGHSMQLHPHRAVVWGDDLLIADPHFGKASAFRAAGLPVPDGTTDADLDRLTQLIDLTSPRRLIVLGDFFHARSGCDEITLDVLARWRSRHGGIEMLLVRGNHDRHAGDPPTPLKIQCVDGPLECQGLHLAHEPPADPATPTLAGHLHPGLKLGDFDRSSVSTSCFVVESNLLILPAFGRFTGLALMPPQPGRRRYAVGSKHVVQVDRVQPVR